MTFVKRGVGATRDVQLRLFKIGHRAGIMALTVSVFLGSPAGANPPHASGGRHGDQPLTMNVLQRFAMEPAIFSAVVYVTPHEDNRLLRIVVDSDYFYTSSDIQLDGLGAPLSHPLRLKALPAGHYCVEATLFRGTQQVSSVRHAYHVIGAAMHVQDVRLDDGPLSSCAMPPSDAWATSLEAADRRRAP